MRTFLTILGALSLLVLAVLLSPIYVISAPAILLIVIIVAVIKAIVNKPRKKGGSK